MNTNSSAVGLARQSAKGTEMAYESGFHWMLAEQAMAGPQEGILALPMEMGGGLFPRGRVKTSVFGAGALSGIPRPESLGLVLLGMFGSSASAEIDPDTTPASGDEYYQHTFTIASDASATDYFTARRTIGSDLTASGTGFGETIVDCRMESMALEMRAADYVRGSYSFNGITPSLVKDPSTWTIDPDSNSPFVAAAGSAKIQTADTSTTLPVRAASIAMTNAQDIARQFIIGSYYPRDVDIVGRTALVSYVVYLPDEAWYQKLIYDPTAVSTTWTPNIFSSSQFELKFISAENCNPSAPSAVNLHPWTLTFTANATHWNVEPLGLAANDLVVVRATGIVLEKDAAGSEITAVLDNQTQDYNVATS
jgi:hypothetical protein